LQIQALALAVGPHAQTEHTRKHTQTMDEAEEDDAPPVLTAEEQAHFDRIASAFHAYATMNRARVLKAERDYERFLPDLHGPPTQPHPQWPKPRAVRD
jgi:hypothetical protein